MPAFHQQANEQLRGGFLFLYALVRNVETNVRTKCISNTVHSMSKHAINQDNVVKFTVYI